jgi:hypothetical protein
MMRRVWAPTVCSLLILTASSCTDTNPIITPSDELLAIDSGIKVYVSELLTSEGRRLELGFYSECTYPTPDFHFRTRTQIMANVIHVEFLGIDHVDGGEQIFTAATGSFIVGAVPKGTYHLFFHVNSDVEYVILKVTDEAYSLDVLYAERCSFPCLTLLRIPEGTIWGSVECWNAQYTSLFESYLDTLETVGAEATSLMPGYYGAFTIDGSGEILPYGRSPDMRPAYCFRYLGDWNVIEDLLCYYATISENALRIWVMGTRGQWLQSWDLVPDSIRQ